MRIYQIKIICKNKKHNMNFGQGIEIKFDKNINQTNAINFRTLTYKPKLLKKLLLYIRTTMLGKPLKKIGLQF